MFTRTVTKKRFAYLIAFIVLLCFVFLSCSTCYADDLGYFPLSVTLACKEAFENPTAAEWLSSETSRGFITVSLLLDYGTEVLDSKQYVPTIDHLSYIGRDGRTLILAFGNEATGDLLVILYNPTDSDPRAAYKAYTDINPVGEAIVTVMSGSCHDGYYKNDGELLYTTLTSIGDKFGLLD